MKGGSRIGRRREGEIPALNLLYDSPLLCDSSPTTHAQGPALPWTAQLLAIQELHGPPNPVPKCSTQSGQSWSLLAFLFLKAASPFSPGSQARNLKVIPTLPAPSSAVTNLSARTATPWKCHSSSPFLLLSPPLSPQPPFRHNTLCPRIFNNSPRPAAIT